VFRGRARPPPDAARLKARTRRVTDAAGLVDAVGEGVRGVVVGDEVIVRDARGAYAEQVVAPS
jgi:NADPH:quinone reductase-like Zn-dependent oxidoreductase